MNLARGMFLEACQTPGTLNRVLALDDIRDTARRIEEGAKAAVSDVIPTCTKSGQRSSCIQRPEAFIIKKLQFFPGVAELADAADSKSAGDHSPCGFDSLLRDQHPKTLS